MSYDFIHSKKMILAPQPGSPWAEEMVLNPGLIEDPKTGRIHMLFRATGPWTRKRLPGKPLPYPIFLGYAYSEDRGETWRADFTRPCLIPALEYDADKIYFLDSQGQKQVNYANGCVEDPRLFFLEGECYMIVACRMFPPGPFWDHDEPTQCAPEWIKTDRNPFGRAASDNVTGNVLYRADLNRLAGGDYDNAFRYITHLTDPAYGENRDVVLFPEKMTLHGRKQYVCLHRPVTPSAYPGMLPSIFICAADRFTNFPRERDTQTLLASPRFPWEKNRIAASAPPLRISAAEWLLCYHGKQDVEVGYTQSFMILEEVPGRFPRIRHRCSERLIIADQPWELPHKSPTPCVFITGLIRLGDILMISYGASDEKVGVAKIDLPALVDYVRKFDDEGIKQ
jgi:predicted GH43/DUF377 family glycosyl hydrolase